MGVEAVDESPKGSGLQPFTVVIPVYNGENYLAQTLESVLAQDYPPVEIIVVNDGSKDTTAEVGASFGDRVRMVNRANAGVANTRNHGISLARTEWVALLDHDDLWQKNHLANIANAIAARPAADLCYTGVRWLVQDSFGHFLPQATVNKTPGETELGDALLDRCPFVPSCVAVRKSAVERVGGFDPRRSQAEDWALWLRLARGDANFVHCPEPTLLYRVHPASVTNMPFVALEQTRRMVEEEIVPYLPRWKRAIHARRVIGRLESEAAILLRENGTPGALPLMLRSIARYPFHEGRRYRIALHMLWHGYRRKEGAS